VKALAPVGQGTEDMGGGAACAAEERVRVVCPSAVVAVAARPATGANPVARGALARMEVVVARARGQARRVPPVRALGRSACSTAALVGAFSGKTHRRARTEARAAKQAMMGVALAALEVSQSLLLPALVR
jgi:hypothetical protein